MRARLEFGYRQIQQATVTPTTMGVSENTGIVDTRSAIFISSGTARICRTTSCDKPTPPQRSKPKSNRIEASIARLRGRLLDLWVGLWRFVGIVVHADDLTTLVVATRRATLGLDAGALGTVEPMCLKLPEGRYSCGVAISRPMARLHFPAAVSLRVGPSAASSSASPLSDIPRSGWEGIRTPGRLTPTAVFKTARHPIEASLATATADCNWCSTMPPVAEMCTAAEAHISTAGSVPLPDRGDDNAETPIS
jgi:hypothetical protein